jgi:uncharacterized glyoxalase superfamily protein PhnB
MTPQAPTTHGALARAAERGLPTLYPSVVYDDAPAAIDWLGRAFAFERHLVVPGPNNTIAHAELSVGPAMIMLGSSSNQPGQKSPKALGANTGGIYVVVDDVDAHAARAKAAGAVIVRPPTDEDYGGRAYTCRDPEGHNWSFGTYLPAPTPQP